MLAPQLTVAKSLSVSIHYSSCVPVGSRMTDSNWAERYPPYLSADLEVVVAVVGVDVEPARAHAAMEVVLRREEMLAAPAFCWERPKPRVWRELLRLDRSWRQAQVCRGSATTRLNADGERENGKSAGDVRYLFLRLWWVYRGCGFGVCC